MGKVQVVPVTDIFKALREVIGNKYQKSRVSRKEEIHIIYVLECYKSLFIYDYLS